ncbi:O-acyltransferase WSD1-like [Cynara cardunculus var. scolymus]|uniref:O-acyltransferase WSD1-like n=1 Tax=Cynara cardunculus var. scolymus TaxID=59895 RepID=UPI000D626FCD|nr:O-acyltransferase WSD1-like [Cynara cardunculus var. scolymus]
MVIEKDEPLTPAGRLFVQPATDQIINCVLGLDRPVGIEVARSVISDSLLIKHPRFTSLLVKDNHGRERWKKVELEIDRHIICLPDALGDHDDETIVNDYIADLTVSCPLSTDKPLWEIHILPPHKCVVIRLHHALGDGVSLLSLMLTMCRKVGDGDKMPTIKPLSTSRSNHRESGVERFWKLLKMMWFTLIYMLEFFMRSLWVRDRETAVRGGAGVELWPRKLATAKFSLDDMKTVKSSGINTTINDVLFAVISSGLSRYLEIHSRKPPQQGTQMTGAAIVNLRPSQGIQEITELMKKKSGSRWGNKFGMMLLPIYYHTNGSDPLEYLKRAKKMIDRKKLSLEPFLSYKIGYFVMKCFGAKFASLLNYRIICNTSFTISNVVGPQEEVMIAGIPVTYIRTTSSSLAHAITMHMMSYAGKAEMQILVAKDLIPQPEKLAKCFEDALLEMKQAALKIGEKPPKFPQNSG